jgi:hypothetical protein
MDELIRHFLLFFPLFIIIRWKIKSWVISLFITLPFIGEAIQLHPVFQNWGFTFEWHDILINYVSALTGWSLVSAIRENQKIKYKKYLLRKMI